mgnify:CR=1 FL=1
MGFDPHRPGLDMIIDAGKDAMLDAGINDADALVLGGKV